MRKQIPFILLVVLSLSSATALADDTEDTFPSGAWIAEKNLNIVNPSLGPAPPGASDAKQHGVYATIPYIGFARDQKSGKLRMVCEQDDSLPLTPVSDTSFVVDGSFTRLDFEKFGGRFVRFKVVGGAIAACGLEDTTYLRAVPAEPCDDGDPDDGSPPFCMDEGVESWEDVFSRHADCVDLMLDGWNPSKMNAPPGIMESGATSAIFAPPRGGTAKRWKAAPNSDEVVPWSQIWTRRPATSRHVVRQKATSESELLSALSRGQSFGMHDGATGLQQNQEVRSQTETLYANELSYFLTDIVATEYALVQDKRNAVFEQKFLSALSTLRDGIEDREWRDFLEQFGTHYAYALTCGGRGFQRAAMEASSVARLLDQRVNINDAVSMGAKGSIEGVDFDLGLDFSETEERELRSKVSNALDRENSLTTCFGSVKCVSDDAQVVENDDIPVYVDLRPVWELLGPPFFTDFDTAVTLRNAVRKRIDATLKASPPRTDSSIRLFKWKFGEVAHFSNGRLVTSKQRELGSKLKVSLTCLPRNDDCAGSILNDGGVLQSQLHELGEVWTVIPRSVETVKITLSSAATGEEAAGLAIAGFPKLPVTGTLPVRDMREGSVSGFEILADFRQELIIAPSNDLGDLRLPVFVELVRPEPAVILAKR